MPIYEYQAPDGTVIELLRPMAEADKPVEDPEGKGRAFTRRQSAFAAKGSSGSPGASASGGCCPCGKGAGMCNSRQN